MPIKETHSVQQTELLGEEIAAGLRGGTVVALFGGLGMGKTALVRGMARVLAPETLVSSPTFALVNDYGGQPPLVHFDMYRVSGYEDVETTGYFDYLDAGAILVVEWSENILAALPEDALRVTFERTGETSRRITIEGGKGQ